MRGDRPISDGWNHLALQRLHRNRGTHCDSYDCSHLLTPLSPEFYRLPLGCLTIPSSPALATDDGTPIDQLDTQMLAFVKGVRDYLIFSLDQIYRGRSTHPNTPSKDWRLL
jgi:hypothetical protein